jgi:hypothetical protein
MRQGLCSRHGSSPLHENSPFHTGRREPNRGKALAPGAQLLRALQNAGFLAADLRSTARPLLLCGPCSLQHNYKATAVGSTVAYGAKLATRLGT